MDGKTDMTEGLGDLGTETGKRRNRDEGMKDDWDDGKKHGSQSIAEGPKGERNVKIGKCENVKIGSRIILNSLTTIVSLSKSYPGGVKC